jgi:hypothetical protein
MAMTKEAVLGGAAGWGELQALNSKAMQQINAFSRSGVVFIGQ